MADTPALVTIPNVPLMETGEWHLSTGLATFTADDLAAAVAAQDDPGVRTPIIKIGHGEQPGGLERPVIGRIENMRTENNGQTLVGDLVGVPKWMADVMAFAYPQRSIEGSWQLKSATGNTHRFALTGVALLGETNPGISTLDDLKSLWESLPEIEVPGVNASHGILVRASTEERTVPTANVKAAVEVDDVRRTFYEDPEMQKALGTWAWIRAVRLDPTDLIVDDDDGGLWRVPYAVADDDSISFSPPVQVIIEYKDQTAAASAATGPVVRFSSKEESRRGTMAEAAAEAETTDTPKEGMMDVPIEQARTLLGLPEDADEATVEEALAAALAAAEEAEPEEEEETEEEPQSDDNPAPPQEAPAPEGADVVTIDRATLESLQRNAAAGAEARERQRTEDRDRFIAAAVKEGRIVPARASFWKGQYDQDEAGTRKFIESQPKGLVPVTETGHGHDGDEVAASAASEYPESWLSPAERQRAAAARTN